MASGFGNFTVGGLKPSQDAPQVCFHVTPPRDPNLGLLWNLIGLLSLLDAPARAGLKGEGTHTSEHLACHRMGSLSWTKQPKKRCALYFVQRGASSRCISLLTIFVWEAH